MSVVWNLVGLFFVFVGVGMGKIWVVMVWIVKFICEGIVFDWIFVVIFMNKVVKEMKEWIGKLLC